MDTAFTEDQRQLKAAVRRFVDERAPIAYVRRMLDDPRGTTDEVWAGLADLGVRGMLVAEAAGGSGGTMVDLGAALEELGRALHPGPLLSTAIVAGTFGDATAIATLAALEPGQRIVDTGRPPATRFAHGTLTGEKQFVPDGADAEVVFVTAAVDEGIAVVAVDGDAPGVERSPVEIVDGTRRFADLSFDGAPGTVVAGAGELALVVDRLLTAYVVDGVGAASRALDLAVEYAQQRHQFGVPIGSFQAVQHLCADMLRDLELARAGGYYALWACDEADPSERHRAATMAKAFGADAFARIGASAVQVFGGVGFTWEHDIHLFYKRLLTAQHVYGDGNDHLAVLADLVVPSAASQ